MSEIRDMYEQIKSLQEKLIKTKLQEAIKAIKEKRELNIEEQRDFSFGPDDVELLKKILDQKVDDIDYDETTYVSFYNHSHLATSIFKIDGDYISIVPYESVKITDIEALRKIFDEHRYSEERKSEMEDLLNGLVDVDLEQLKRRTQERMPNKSIEPEETIEEEVQENKAKDEMFRRIILEKIKYIESSSIEDIPYDYFTQAEASNLLKYLRGNEGYIVSREVEEDTRSVEEEDAGYPPQIELVCYDTIRLGDKVLYFDDSSGQHEVLEITDEESYVRKHYYGEESLPEKTLTVSQIEQLMQGKNELTKGVDIEYPIEEELQGNQTKDEMFRRVILEKLKYIESSSIEDIPFDYFTYAEASNLLKYLRENEGYIVSREVEEDTNDMYQSEAGCPPQIELVHYDAIRLGDKVLYFDDSELQAPLGVTDEASYVKSYHYRYIVKSLPEKTLTVSQIEQLMQGKNELTKGVEHTAEEIGDGVKDLTQGELGDALTAITHISEPQKDHTV